MLIGRTPSSSSSRATSIGESRSCFRSRRTGAPIDIWRALAPTTLAFSKRVSFGGPISMLSGSLVIAASLVVTLVLSLRAAWATSAGFRSSDNVVDLQYHARCLSRRFYHLYFYPNWFENTSFLEISDFRLVNIDPGPELSFLVGNSELNENVDRVHARIFSQSCRKGFEGLAEGYNRQLFFSGEFLCMFSEASCAFCFWGTPASHDSWVKYNVAHNA